MTPTTTPTPGTAARRTTRARRRAAAVLACLALTLPVVAATPSVAPAAAPGGFTGINPVRVLDTRATGQGPCLQPGATRDVLVAGLAGIPADAAGVAFNITAVGATLPGFVTAWPHGGARPLASTVNYAPGTVTPNNAVLAVGSAQRIDLFANQGCPHVIIDVVGWFAAGTPASGGFHGTAPTRLLDTRTTGGCVTSPRSLVVAGLAGVPSDAGAVALNVTVTGASLPGFVVAWPAGATMPTASTVNYVAGETRANTTVVKVGSLGSVLLHASGGCPHIVVDLVGWFSGGSPIAVGGIGAVTPYRVLDTRSPSNPEGCLRGYRAFTVAGVPGSGVPYDADSVLLNVTVTDPGGPGYLTVFPDLATPPTASNLNFVGGQTVANGVWVKVNAANHRVTLFASGGCPHVVVDVVGAALTTMQPAPDPAVVATQTVRTPQWPDVSDPAVLVDAGKYYVFGSNTNVRNVPVRTVTSLTTSYSLSGWEAITAEAMPTRPAWARQDERTLWAPTVAKLAPNFYVMYFAANRPAVATNSQCVGRAYATAPQGPYTPDATPITCGIDGTGGGLDPEFFHDPVGGGDYLYAAFSDSDWPIHVIPVDTWGTPLRAADAQPARLTELERALVGWQTAPKVGFVENPSMTYDASTGTYLLAFSIGPWKTADYTTGIVRCTSPVGPCSLQSTTPWLASGNGRTGPGGLTFFSALDGTRRAAYASWPAGHEGQSGYWRAGSLATVSLGVAPTLG
jgi:hypothetical protein